MNIVNLTPHSITVRLPEGDRVFTPDGRVARCTISATPISPIDGITLNRSVMGELNGLPDPEEGTVYITSTPAAQKAAALGRTDVVSPDTGPTAIRENGQVVAVRGFQCF